MLTKTRNGLLVVLVVLALPVIARAWGDGASNTLLVGEEPPLPVELERPWAALWEELESGGGRGRASVRIRVGSLAAHPELAAAVESGRRLPAATLVREEGGGRSAIEFRYVQVKRFQILGAGRDSGSGPQTLLLEGEFRLVFAPRTVRRAANDKWIELISVSPGSPSSVHVKVFSSGDLLERIGRGQAGGPGRIVLEGDQALVFFLGGIPARSEPIPELRARTAEGRAFVLKGVRVESLESAGGSARSHLLYQDLVIPPM